MRLPVLLLAACLGCPPMVAAAARVNDFPTADRVLYVQDCMRDHPGPAFEMTNKCSCAVDTIAREVSYSDYVTMTTAVNGMGIAGERGNDFRDNESLKPEVKRWRDLQKKAAAACFLERR
jgi:hypothetical protein